MAIGIFAVVHYSKMMMASPSRFLRQITIYNNSSTMNFRRPDYLVANTTARFLAGSLFLDNNKMSQ